MTGRRGCVYFSASRGPLLQPALLRNGWYAATCLNNSQKVRLLDSLAEQIKFKRGVDWEWQARGYDHPSIHQRRRALGSIRTVGLQDG